YQYASLTPGSANQQVIVPTAGPGTWYILVYSSYVPSPSNYTLVASTSSIFLTGVTPDHYGNSQDATLTLSGSGFTNTPTVALVAAGGARYPASTVRVNTPNSLTATFAAGTVPAGTYSVTASQTNGDSATLPNAFHEVQGGTPHLVTNIIIPNPIGYH